jgi:hypothetical protein
VSTRARKLSGNANAYDMNAVSSLLLVSEKMPHSESDHCIVETQHRSYVDKSIFDLVRVQNINICNKNGHMSKKLESVNDMEL